MYLCTVWKKVVRVTTALLLVSGFCAEAQIAERASLQSHVPKIVAGLPAQGRLDAATQLKLSINLPLHNPEALTNFLAQVYDPSSPLYRQYLTPDEFDARFGPTPEDYEAVAEWAATNGFTITQRHPNRMLLEVTATAANIERALQVTMRTYQHPTEARTFFSPDAEPTIAAGVPILHIAGLDNFSRPHPKNLRRAPIDPIVSKEITAKQGSGPNGNLAGFDYRAAYVPGVTLTGTGQSVGLLEFDGYYAGDITAYESLMGLPNVPLQKVLLDGFDGVPTTGSSSGNGEVALDIEMAISMAPGLSKVVVYEADPFAGQPNDILQAMSTNTTIKQFSCSWSFGTPTSAGRSAMDNYFQKFAAQGQSFFDASGDDGVIVGPAPSPDDDPYVTIVGGTTLATAAPKGAWLSEVVWSTQQGPGFNESTGGVSTTYAIPTWQQGVNMSTNKGSTTKRNTPDVAMVADNIFIYADNGQQETTGGTSAAAPLWAGFAALVNQQSVAAGGSTIGFINPAIYKIGTNANYTASFNDVTVGNNTNNNVNQYVAVPGFDLCTGWGSPTGSSLMIALAKPDGFQIKPGRGPVANGPAGGPFTVAAQTFVLTNTSAAAITWSLGSSSPWLNVSTNGGVINSGAATSVTVALNGAANSLASGVYTANVWLTNVTSGLTQLRQFTLRVDENIVQDGGFEAGDFTYWTLSGNSAAFSDNFVDSGASTSYTPFEGNYFGALGQVTTVAFLSQPLPTRPGQAYLLSFWLENPSGATPNQFTVYWNTNGNTSNVIFNQSNMGISDWTQMTYLLKTTTNVTTLKFGFRNDKDAFGLDAISVTPVPVPALQATIVSSGLQLVWASAAGLNYQVQYKTDLTQATWINLGGPVTATSTQTSLTDIFGTDPSRFYRVEILP